MSEPDTQRELVERMEAAVDDLSRLADAMYDAARVNEATAEKMATASSRMREAAGTIAMARPW